MKAVLFKSEKRFAAFKRKLEEYGVEAMVLDFAKPEWVGYDYSTVDFLIYFPSFSYSSNHPLALSQVHDNLMYLHSKYPSLIMFPDPNAIPFYNDKYRQFLFLKGNNFPMPETIALVAMHGVEEAERKLGYPMVLKNRYGAGGGSVFRVGNRRELLKYYDISQMNFFSRGAVRFLLGEISKREFYFFLIKARKANYPFLSPPLLAQEFVHIDRDLKTVVGNFKVVEAHWRLQADESMWKMNIDGGGTGVWGHVPEEAIEISVRLAKALGTRWLNLDMIVKDNRFLITEFSPVWHHYAYREKPSFIYRGDYNIDPPLEISLDLERMIVESLMEASTEGE